MSVSDASAPMGATVRIDQLDDPARCPACFTGPLDAAARCPGCGLSLRSERLAEVWRLSAKAAPLLRARASLLARVRTEDAQDPAPAESAPMTSYEVPVALPPAYVPQARPVEAPTFAPAAEAPAPQEASALSVRSLLLGLGVLLLAVAAVIFMVVAWGNAGVGGRALLLGAVTAATAAGSAAALRRGLSATAEALATLVACFVCLDAYALWTVATLNLPGVSYTALVCAAGATAAGLVAARSTLLTPRVVAAVGAQLPLPLLAADASSSIAASLLVLQVAAAVVVERKLAPTAERVALTLVRAGLVPAAGVATLLALATAAAGLPADRPVGSFLLAALALCAAGAAYLHRRTPGIATPAAGAATALLKLSALTAAFAAGMPLRYWAVALGSLALAVAAGVALLSGKRAGDEHGANSYRDGMAAVAAMGAVVVATAQTVPLAGLLLGPFAWLGRPWSAAAGAAASTVVTPFAAVGGEGMALVAACLAAAVFLLLAVALPAVRAAACVAGGALTVMVLAAAPGTFPVPHVAAVMLQLVLAACLLLAAPRSALPGAVRAALPAGLAVLAVAVAWSLAAEATTLVALAVAALLLGVAAIRASADDDRVRAGLPAALAAGAGVAEAGALSLSAGASGAAAASWAATTAAVLVAAAAWLPHRSRTAVLVGGAAAYLFALPVSMSAVAPGALALTAGAIGATLLALRSRQASAAAVSAALACAAAPLAATAFATGLLHPATAAVAAAAVTVLVGAWALRASAAGPWVEVVGTAAYPTALSAAAVAAGLGPRWLGFALLAGAAVAAAVSARDDRRTAMVATAVLVCTGVPTLAAGYGVEQASVILLGATVSALVALGGTFLWHSRPGDRGVEAAGAAGYVVAVLAGVSALAWPAGTTLHDLSVLLTVGGVAAAAAAVRPDRRDLGRLAGGLLAGALWARLAGSSVAVVEAYTVPSALALLAIGLWRARRTAADAAGVRVAPSSWVLYRNGLTLGLVPSLLVSLGDDGAVRPVLLALVAVLVVLWGAASRLRAPMVIGGAVLTVDVLVHLAEYAGAVPRWISFGLAGVLLLAVGSTYERRMRDLRRLRQGYEALS